MKSLLKEIVLSLIVPLSELIWTTVSLGGQSTAAGGGEPRGSGPAGGGGLPRGHAAGEDPERPGWHSTVTATHPQRSPESAVTSWDLTPDPWPQTLDCLFTNCTSETSVLNGFKSSIYDGVKVVWMKVDWWSGEFEFETSNWRSLMSAIYFPFYFFFTSFNFQNVFGLK